MLLEEKKKKNMTNNPCQTVTLHNLILLILQLKFNYKIKSITIKLLSMETYVNTHTHTHKQRRKKKTCIKARTEGETLVAVKTTIHFALGIFCH